MLLDKIPPTVWGVLIGSLIASVATLAGVFITNVSQDRRLKAQLAHDRELKNRERELSWRKEVFLTAAEAISAGFIAIGRMTNLDIATEHLPDDYLEKAPALTKINLIATEATVRAISLLTGELTTAFLRLMTKRFPILRQQQQITFFRSQFDMHLKEQAKILEQMKQHNLRGIADEHEWAVLQRGFDLEKNRNDELSETLTTLTAQQLSEHLNFMKAAHEEMISVSRLLVPVIVSIRKELEIPIDENAYKQMLEDSISKQVHSMQDFASEVQAIIPSI